MAAYSGFPEESYDTVFIILDKMDKIGTRRRGRRAGGRTDLQKTAVDKYLSLFEEVTGRCRNGVTVRLKDTSGRLPGCRRSQQNLGDDHREC